MLFYGKENNVYMLGEGFLVRENRKDFKFKQEIVVDKIQSQYLSPGYYEFPFWVRIP